MWIAFPWLAAVTPHSPATRYHTFLCKLWCNATWLISTGIPGMSGGRAYFVHTASIIHFWTAKYVVQFRDHYIMLPANARWLYTVTPSLISWAKTQYRMVPDSLMIIDIVSLWLIIPFFSSVYPLTNTLWDHWTIGPLSTGKITYSRLSNKRGERNKRVGGQEVKCAIKGLYGIKGLGAQFFFFFFFYTKHRCLQA